MMRIMVTTEFCNSSRHLVSSKNQDAVHNLRTVLILLANGKPVPKKFHDHQLVNSQFRELHVAGDVLLLYRYETDSNTLLVSLKLTNITDHKKLSKDSNKKNYTYTEVPTTFLHDVTSSTQLSELDNEDLIDISESIADYANMLMSDGYVLLSDCSINDNLVDCIYDFYSYTNGQLVDSIDFVINLTDYAVNYIGELSSYIDEFALQVSNAFKEE